MTDPKTAVIACSVMKLELLAAAGGRDLDFRFLDQGLHRTPARMGPRIQAAVEEAQGQGIDRIVLGYGLCSNGVVGVRGRAHLIVPRCHDCIALFLGSARRHEEMFRERPGTYYLSPGWVAEGKDPLSVMDLEYRAQVGPEDARWVMEEELRHYTHIGYINNGLGDVNALRARARENASVFGKAFLEVDGGLEYFQKMLAGPAAGDDFIVLAPGTGLEEKMFR